MKWRLLIVCLFLTVLNFAIIASILNLGISMKYEVTEGLLFASDVRAAKAIHYRDMTTILLFFLGVDTMVNMLLLSIGWGRKMQEQGLVKKVLSAGLSLLQPIFIGSWIWLILA